MKAVLLGQSSGNHLLPPLCQQQALKSCWARVIPADTQSIRSPMSVEEVGVGFWKEWKNGKLQQRNPRITLFWRKYNRTLPLLLVAPLILSLSLASQGTTLCSPALLKINTSLGGCPQNTKGSLGVFHSTLLVSGQAWAGPAL